MGLGPVYVRVGEGGRWEVDGQELKPGGREHEQMQAVARILGGSPYALDAAQHFEDRARLYGWDQAGAEATFRNDFERCCAAVRRSFVGVWIEREMRVVTKGFEYAGQGWTGETIPGRYKLRVEPSGYWICTTMKATHTRSWFQSRIGATYGSNNLCTDRKPDTYGEQHEFYSLARHVLAGRVVLAPGWRVDWCDGAKYSDGRPQVRLVRDEPRQMTEG